MYIDYEFDNSECHCDEDFNFPLSNIKEKNSKKWKQESQLNLRQVFYPKFKYFIDSLQKCQVFCTLFYTKQNSTQESLKFMTQQEKIITVNNLSDKAQKILFLIKGDGNSCLALQYILLFGQSQGGTLSHKQPPLSPINLINQSPKKSSTFLSQRKSEFQTSSIDFIKNSTSNASNRLKQLTSSNKLQNIFSQRNQSNIIQNDISKMKRSDQKSFMDKLTDMKQFVFQDKQTSFTNQDNNSITAHEWEQIQQMELQEMQEKMKKEQQEIIKDIDNIAIIEEKDDKYSQNSNNSGFTYDNEMMIVLCESWISKEFLQMHQIMEESKGLLAQSFQNNLKQKFKALNGMKILIWKDFEGEEYNTLKKCAIRKGGLIQENQKQIDFVVVKYYHPELKQYEQVKKDILVCYHEEPPSLNRYTIKK